ncbi:ABC transporter permease subunit [Pseudokineococcus lusitanus]|uniref:ABC-type transport system involved in multi-copper enzyme maturation permease subunit n=1 Tax=Pseudokineococcus lusitanus TaxID=763993 RepID=A0A3N1HKQ5_9ACTN|nr:ABC transporter permease subunit [Pseudokineococcus lusitanus]ROP42922.1 ABC-type transport system involved in multi-copper enzyme maturation permease subunit [Pseudokineococcus lusitanus]
MSTTTTAPTTTARAHRPPTGRVTFLGVVRGEWTKLRSLRSTWAVLLLAVALGVGLSALTGWALADGSGGGPGGGPGGPPGAPADTVGRVLSSTSLASLLLGVLGALVMTGEHASGTVTTSLAAVPRRWPLLAAKAVVVVAVVAPVAVLTSCLALVTASALLPAEQAVALTDAGVPTAVLGSSAAMVATALLGLGLGTLLRSTAGAITLLVALVFVAPPLLPLIPVDWLQTAVGHNSVAAGQSLSVVDGEHTLSTTAAWWTLAGWALVPLAAGALLLRRRDV